VNIEFTAVAEAFEDAAFGIPLLAAPQMSAAIIQTRDLTLIISSEPHAGRGYVKGCIGINVLHDLR